MPFDVQKFMEFGLTEGEKHFYRLRRAMEQGQTPPADTLQFLSDAGQRILDGADPKKALKLEKTQGRKKNNGNVIHGHITITQIICGLMDDYGFTKDQALDRISEIMSKIPKVKGYSRRSLVRYYDTYHKLARESNASDKRFDEILERYRDHQK